MQFKVSKEKNSEEATGLLRDEDSFAVKEQDEEGNCSALFSWCTRGNQPTNGRIEVFFLLLTAMVGSGIHAQPFCFRISGIGLTLFLYAMIGIMTWLGMKLLIRSAERVEVYEYADLGHRLLGPVGKTSVEASIILGNFGCFLSYLIMVAVLLSGVIESVISPPNFYCSPIFVAVIAMFSIIGPLCLVRHFGHLAGTDYFN